MNLRHIVLPVLLSAAAPAWAGGDKVAFPEGFEKGVLYATVDRPDVKQYRELYAPKASVDALQAGQPLPSGTVLTLVQYKAKLDAKGEPLVGPNGRFLRGELAAIVVMEKRSGWGTEYADDIRNGEWEYQSFTPERKVNDKAKLEACFKCHKPHDDTDFVFSFNRIKAYVASANVRGGQK
ncbi:MAG: cytochrome P460 family protein [Betaproteobacteria bacterium]|nr:cytochrome P460 family protein [Betaproteobacteria bacterium]